MECAPTRHLQCSLHRGLPPPPGGLAGSVGEAILFLLAPGSINALYVSFCDNAPNAPDLHSSTQPTVIFSWSEGRRLIKKKMYVNPLLYRFLISVCFHGNIHVCVSIRDILYKMSYSFIFIFLLIMTPWVIYPRKVHALKWKILRVASL